MKKAFVLINSELGSEASLKADLKRIPGVVGVYVVYGMYDMIAEVEAESDWKLKDVIFTRIRTMEHVRSTLTLNSV